MLVCVNQHRPLDSCKKSTEIGLNIACYFKGLNIACLCIDEYLDYSDIIPTFPQQMQCQVLDRPEHASGFLQ